MDAEYFFPMLLKCLTEQEETPLDVKFVSLAFNNFNFGLLFSVLILLLVEEFEFGIASLN